MSSKPYQGISRISNLAGNYLKIQHRLVYLARCSVGPRDPEFRLVLFIYLLNPKQMTLIANFQVIAIVSKNYKVKEQETLIHFTNMSKAIDYAKEYMKEKLAKNVSELLPVDQERFRGERFEYDSYYGGYPCGLEFEKISVY
jgi:hypothetical protein